jgi:hypothetical protein
VVAVDPAKAAEWLALSIKREPLREDLVRHYARIMAAGQWRHDDGSKPIAFSSDGSRLIDGNHRLTAVMRSGVTVSLRVKHITGM